jgi:hypothetical protein
MKELLADRHPVKGGPRPSRSFLAEMKDHSGGNPEIVLNVVGRIGQARIQIFHLK